MRPASVYCQYIVTPPAYFPNLHHARDASSVSELTGGDRARVHADALSSGVRGNDLGMPRCATIDDGNLFVVCFTSE